MINTQIDRVSWRFKSKVRGLNENGKVSVPVETAGVPVEAAVKETAVVSSFKTLA